MKGHFTLTLLVVLFLSVAAVAGTVTGKITEAGTNDVLPGANVTIEGTRIGAASGTNGVYTISNVPANEDALRLGPARLVYVAGNGPLLDGMGMINSLIRYQQVINFCITSCPELLPDAAGLGRAARKELDSLRQAIRRAR